MIPPIQPVVAAVQFLQTVILFLDFIQVVTLLFGIPKIGQGAWQISRGMYGDGIASVVAGFLCSMSVPIIRMFASWMGVSM